MNQVHKAVIANSMWRTGSTYLAKQFADAPQYRMFYEPCHELVPSVSVVNASKEDWAAYFKRMRHPQFDEQPFAVYNEIDAATNRRLNELFDPACPFRNIYNEGSERTVEYLRAAARVAESTNKVPFFGFCRSGFQHAAWDRAFDGQHFYLWRDPREQFRSYGWGRDNVYFVPATMAQLLYSDTLAPIVDQLASPWRAKTMRLILRQVPAGSRRVVLRLGYIFARQLPMNRAYALYYLSWLTSYLSNARTNDLAFSLDQLARDASLKDRLEHDYGIAIRQLRETPNETVEGIDYGNAEREVEALFDRILSRSDAFAAMATVPKGVRES